MSQNVLNPFAINDTDESLKTKAGGVFGLNPSVNVVNIEYKDKNKDGDESHSVTLEVQVGDRTYKRFFYFNKGEKVFIKNVLSGPEVEGYNEAYFPLLVQRIAVIKHTLKAVGVSQQVIDQVSAQLDPEDVAGGVKALVELVPANYKTVPVDIFLEYQWSIKKDKDGKSMGRTFLEFPDSMKGGIFLVPAVKPVGTWTEIINAEGLSYVDNTGGTHPFTRSKGYMESPRAAEQTEEGNKEKQKSNFNASAGNPQSAKTSKWG